MALFQVHGFLFIWPNHSVCGIQTKHQEAMCHAPFSGDKVRVKVTQVVSSFGPVCSVVVSLFDLLDIRHIYNIWRATCRAPFPGWKVKVTRVISRFWPCPRHGFVPIWPNNFICGIHTTHDGRSACTIFRMKGQKSRSHGSFKILALSAPLIYPFLSCLLRGYMDIGVAFCC